MIHPKSQPDSNYSGALVLVGGPSCVGKTSALDALIQRAPAFRRPISFTSRKPREGEGNSEYVFTDKESIVRLYERGEAPTIDCVYGSYYAMTRASIEALWSEGKIAIKEVHPENHGKIRQYFPNLVSLLILPVDLRASINARHTPQERADEDLKYYDHIDLSAFDIVIYTTLEDTSMDLSLIVQQKVRTFLAAAGRYPSPREIQKVNKMGYEKIAMEFTEDRRVTTRNFHQLSRRFFSEQIARLPNGCRCAELGPGRGWLRAEIKWPTVEYQAIELSPSMIRGLLGCKVIAADVCAIPVPKQHYDVVFASLADPYAHPMAFVEIRRILRPEGRLVLSTPSGVWSSGVRTKESRWKTTFIPSAGVPVEVYSFTYTKNELADLLRSCEFSICSAETAYGRDLPPNSEVSPAITGSATRLGMSLADLPIVDNLVAQRCDMDYEE